MVTDSDAIGLRAECSVLLRNVELAVNALPARHDREALLRHRPTWARAIFGLGLSDTAGGAIPAHDVVPEAALDALHMISSILSYAAPEHRPKGSDDELTKALEDIHDALGKLRGDVALAEDIPETARGRIVVQLINVLELVKWVRTRGFTQLHSGLLSAQLEVQTVSDEAATLGQSGMLSKLKQLASRVEDIVKILERVVVPPAVGITAGIAAHSIEAGLEAVMVARLALDRGSSNPAMSGHEPRRQLERGSQPSDTS
ncbi:MAG: hypothetical protein ACRDRL_09625 [Sciscionella sp.]